jgi:hypothetical protein
MSQKLVFPERLGPPPVLYIPQPVKGSLPYRVYRWLYQKWFQYKVATALYMIEDWEIVLVHLVLLGILAIIAYGL